MKKKIITLLISALLASGMGTMNVFAYTANYVDNSTNEVNLSQALTQEEAPALVIQSSKDLTEDFNFELMLAGAEWNLPQSGNFGQDGITYTKSIPTRIMVYVNVPDGKKDENGTFDAVNQDIRIPLAAKIKQSGNITVTINELNSKVSDGAYVFAECLNDGTRTIAPDTVMNISGEWTFDEVVYKDTSTQGIRAGQNVKLKLLSGFTFEKGAKISGTGKYENRVEFEISSSDPSVAYLKIITSTSSGTGEIVLEDLTIAPSSNSAYGPVKLKAYYDNESRVISSVIANYKSKEVIAAPLVIDDIERGDFRPILTGTGTTGETVVGKIDGIIMDIVTVGDDGKWSIPYKKSYKTLSEGTHMAEVSYFRSSTGKETDTVTKEFTTKEKGAPAIFAVGASDYTTINNIKFPTDAPVYIDENGCAMLPLRIVAKALGMNENAIEWNEKTQTAAFVNAEGFRVSIHIGDEKLLYDGIWKDMSTKAVIKNDRVYLPLRSTVQAFGIIDDNIEWDEKTQTIRIYPN